MERNAFLINKKIHQYILPGVLMTVAMQLGNVVDGMIVGNLLGAEAMAAMKSVMINSAIVRILGNGPMAVYSVCANAALIAPMLR